ncbi:NAD(P)H-binding protein [Streptomyces sp. NPDC047049]|uniref:NmrA family NAD(P)-binding protein n=1 Tax=Streptomyces sp. NPDC047049 TaxID=3156688 RepID=UPI0033C27A18
MPRPPHPGENAERVRQGSFTDAAGLAHAFEGASQVLIVSVDTMGEECVRQHRTAIEAAVAAGARRILYTSHMGASATSHFQACRDHAATEEALRACGVPFTSLRNGFYTTSALHFLGNAVESGRFALPEDGPVAWTAHADLADATAAILADEGRFDGPTPPLTGGQSLSFDDIAALATELAGRTMTRTTVPDDQFREQLVSQGVPSEVADQLLGIFAAGRAGEFATVDPTWPPCSAANPSPWARCCASNCPQADPRRGSAGCRYRQSSPCRPPGQGQADRRTALCPRAEVS